MPGTPLRMSVYRQGPLIMSSRTISNVQRSPTTSRALASAQNCPYDRT